MILQLLLLLSRVEFQGRAEGKLTNSDGGSPKFMSAVRSAGLAIRIGSELLIDRRLDNLSVSTLSCRYESKSMWELF
ncbi:hypothetical protein TWF128_009874 [Orbilia oligospora]|nr:hypothetical protein TWF128_009874 [Orbilia oligospora]